MYSLCAFVLILSLAAATEVKFKDCGSKTGVLKKVDVSGCDTTPCPLKRGTSVKLSAEFTSNVDTKKLTAVVHGKIGGIPLPFNIPNPDGCNKSNIKCPVTKGSDLKYVNEIPVSSNYPKVRVTVEWELRDENNNDIFCFLIPAEITD